MVDPGAKTSALPTNGAHPADVGRGSVVHPPRGDLRRLAHPDGLSAEAAIGRAHAALKEMRAQAPQTLRTEIAEVLERVRAEASDPAALQRPEVRGLFGRLHDLIGLASFAGRGQIKRVVTSAIRVLEELDTGAPKVRDAWAVHLEALELAAIAARPGGCPLSPTLGDDLEAMVTHLGESYAVALPFWACFSQGPGEEAERS